jgi:hypothetical protein
MAAPTREIEEIDPASEDDDARSVASGYSQASTKKYEQEPWPTFQHKVAQLGTQLFPSSLPSDIEVLRMHGGNDNRIVGLTIHASSAKKYSLGWFREAFRSVVGRPVQKEEQKYILRIPRFGASGMGHDLAVLRFAASRVSCPIPEVLSFDFTKNNPLGMGYALQRRLPGQCLLHIWDSLNIHQKMSLTQQLISIIKTLRTITNTSCAVIDGSTFDAAPSQPFALRTLNVPSHANREDNFGIPRSSPATAQTPLQFILDQCDRYKHFQRNLWAADELDPDEHWDHFASIATYLHAQGFLPDESSFPFTHLDLAHRNIMVSVDSDESVTITGVLDWDSSLFAPFYMAYRAPYWLWMDEEAEEDDENQALREPSEEDKRELKKIFNEEADEDWKKLAYTPEYIFLRRMFPFLQEGCYSTWMQDGCDMIVKDWEEYMAEKDPSYKLRETDDDDYVSDTDSEYESDDVSDSGAEDGNKQEDSPLTDTFSDDPAENSGTGTKNDSPMSTKTADFDEMEVNTPSSPTTEKAKDCVSDE